MQVNTAHIVLWSKLPKLKHIQLLYKSSVSEVWQQIVPESLSCYMAKAQSPNLVHVWLTRSIRVSAECSLKTIPEWPVMEESSYAGQDKLSLLQLQQFLVHSGKWRTWKMSAYPDSEATPSWIRAPPESFIPMSGAPTNIAWSITYEQLPENYRVLFWWPCSGFQSCWANTRIKSTIFTVRSIARIGMVE